MCLGRQHISLDCCSTRKCTNCWGRHHFSICVTNYREGQSVATTPVQGKSPTLTGLPESTTSSVTAVQPAVSSKGEKWLPISSLHYVDARMQVLLQTARVVVYNPHLPHIHMKIRVLFDGGSQRSYLTKHVMEALSIKADGVKAMLIKTFGTDREQKRDCDVVKLGMKMKDGGCLEMSLLAVPLICEPLTAQPTIQALENCEHLEGIELADPSCGDEDLKIDVLIGSDHYWKLVTGGVI